MCPNIIMEAPSPSPPLHLSHHHHHHHHPPPPPPVHPKKGNIVTITYTLTPENNYVPLPLFHTTGTNTRLILHWGNYLPGLHDLISTMTVGQTVSNISIDAGWGEKDPSLIARVPKQQQEGRKIGNVEYKDVEVGMKFVLKQGKDSLKVVVTEVTEDDFVLDANPPLAGSSYDCTVTLVDVEEGPLDMMDLVERDDDDAGGMETKKKKKQSEALDGGEASSNDVKCNCAECCCNSKRENQYEAATFALGCFWGAELAFMRTPGVVGTRVGYTRGAETKTRPSKQQDQEENDDHHHPTYDEVCVGNTGLAEAILVIYDPNVVSYKELVNIALERLKIDAESQSMGLASLFEEEEEEEGQNWKRNQYRHGFYYHTLEQKMIAEKMLSIHDNDHDEENVLHQEEKKDEDGAVHYSTPLQKIKEKVEIKGASTFYEAEEYHQQYLLKGGQSARKGEKETIRCFG